MRIIEGFPEAVEIQPNIWRFVVKHHTSKRKWWAEVGGFWLGAAAWIPATALVGGNGFAGGGVAIVIGILFALFGAKKKTTVIVGPGLLQINNASLDTNGALQYDTVPHPESAMNQDVAYWRQAEERRTGKLIRHSVDRFWCSVILTDGYPNIIMELPNREQAQKVTARVRQLINATQGTGESVEQWL